MERGWMGKVLGLRWLDAQYVIFFFFISDYPKIQYFLQLVTKSYHILNFFTFTDNHSYCQCGFANPEAIQRRKQQFEAARQKERFRQEQEILRKEQESEDLRRMLREATRTNMVLQRQIDDREAVDRERLNNELFAQQMQGVIVDDEEN